MFITRDENEAVLIAVEKPGEPTANHGFVHFTAIGRAVVDAQRNDPFKIRQGCSTNRDALHKMRLWVNRTGNKHKEIVTSIERTNTRWACAANRCCQVVDVDDDRTGVARQHDR